MADSVHTQNNKSQFHKTVCLYEWWLTWAYNQNHEKRLAIAGYTSRDQQALGVFSSAPILKRHDVFTLETTDGINVMISGYMNITRTAENGFPPEMISSYFLFGFPLHWEAYLEFFLAQGSDSNSARAAKSTDHRIASDVEKDNILKEKTAIKEARLAGKNTCTDVLREDASLKGCSHANEDKTEKISRLSFSPASADLKLDQNLTVCITREGSKKSIKAGYISTASGAKDTGCKSNSAFKKGCTKKEKNATKKANKAGKKTCDVVSRANKEKYERINGEANVNSANAGAKLDKKYGVRYITRSCGSKKTDHKKSAVVEKENLLTEKSATKEVSASEMKTKRKLKYGSPVALQVEGVTSIVSPESSCIKKSRSGRSLLPTLEYWRNQTAVYGVDHQIIGIKDIISTPSKEDASLKGCSQANEDKSEKINRLSFSPASADPKLDQDLTVCITREGSKKPTKAVGYISMASGAKDTSCKSTSSFKKGCTAGKKTCDVVSRANKEKHETINGEANVSSANADAKLDKKYAVRYITRSCGSKKTDHNKSAVVEKENVLTEKDATKEVSASEMKTERKLKYGSPVALQVEEVTSIVSPELSSIKKSRSGRLLLPTLEFWRNQRAVYGVDRQVIGIKDIISTPSKVEVTPEPKKAKGKSK